MGRKGTFSILDYICQHLGSESAQFLPKLCVCSENWFNFCLTLPLCDSPDLVPGNLAEGRLSIIYLFPSSVTYYQHHKNVESSIPNIYVV